MRKDAPQSRRVQASVWFLQKAFRLDLPVPTATLRDNATGVGPEEPPFRQNGPGGGIVLGVIRISSSTSLLLANRELS